MFIIAQIQYIVNTVAVYFQNNLQTIFVTKIYQAVPTATSALPIPLGFISIGMFLHKLLKLGFAFFGFQQLFNFFNEYGSKRVKSFFGNVRLKNNFRIVDKRHLLNLIASISAGGGQSKIHHKILLTGGDGCHRPVLICPCFHIYQSRAFGDVMFTLKNSFLNIKNSGEVTWFFCWSLLLLNRFLLPCNDDGRDFR